jgi:hypothetical protein
LKVQAGFCPNLCPALLPEILEITPVTTLTGRRLPGPSGFLPPS